MKRRKILLLIAYSVRETGTAPPWSVLRRALGVDRGKFKTLMHVMRRDGFVTFDYKPGSARVTHKGIDWALSESRKSRPLDVVGSGT